MAVMQWQQLFNRKRLGQDQAANERLTRTAFQKDFDRIVFSSAFRRLQDKTQVFPLAQSDYVRTRLTHSLEASCVGRSLGTDVGQRLIDADPALQQVFHPSEMGAIVAAACLAHDIGNPPFGHSGEDAISHWFRESPKGREVIAQLQQEQACAADFLQFEGNAQGFRILSRLEHPESRGGMQLTCPTLAAFTKYPRSAGENRRWKKHGFFAEDAELFAEAAEQLGLLRDGQTYARHPLAFLVEAADDICYHVIDIEDGYRMKLLDFSQTCSLLSAVCDPTPDLEFRLRQMQDRPLSAVQYLRARAIGSLVTETVEAFIANLTGILEGTFNQPLAQIIPHRAEFTQLVEIAARQVYCEREVVLVETAGFNVLGKLIETFLQSINDLATGQLHSSHQSRIVWKLFPKTFIGGDRSEPGELSLYKRVIAVTDYVSSLSDRNAVSLFKRLTGISLPGE
jgi:dGTPase